jgi:hypothetical protein
MRVLVRDHRKEKHRRNENELLERSIQFVGAEWSILRWKLAPLHYFGSLT